MSSVHTTPSKTVYALKSPYPAPSWPTVTPQLESAILDLLLPILEPIGNGRQKQLKTCGKKSKRRVKKHGAISAETVRKSTINEAMQKPAYNHDLEKHLTVGFNSTVRCLEQLSQQASSASSNVVPFVVFVSQSTLPPVMTVPFPTLITTASASLPAVERIRLVPVSPSSATRIAATLNQPRVNVLALLRNVTQFAELQRLIRDEVSTIDGPWLHNSVSHTYFPVQIFSEEVVVSKPAQKDKKRKREGEPEGANA